MLSAAPVALRAGARRAAARQTAPVLAAARPNQSSIHWSQSARWNSSSRSLASATARYSPLRQAARQAVASNGNTGVVVQRRGYAATTNPDPPLDKKNASNDVPSRIGLIGARGYTGQALIDLFDKHPNMDLRHVSSRELAGQNLDGYTTRKIVYEHLTPEDVAELDKKGEVDCWVMALPNGVCKPYVDALDQVETEKKSLIIDLSADYRFDDTWAYGLPELTKRSTISLSNRISNPGCYATAAQLSIAPLLDHLRGEPVVFGVSGYSGAGTKPSPKNDINLLRDNLMPYSLTGHMHEQEISHQLGTAVHFIPHVSSWFRALHLTINIPLNKTMTSREVRQIFQDRYAGERLVKVVGEAPFVRNLAEAHHCEIGGFAVDSTGKRAVVCASLDNLNKGAATQCLQNMNLALGYAEYEGIPTS